MTQRAKEMPLPFRSNGQDGRYDHTKPSEQLPDWSYTRPWATNEERLTSQALSSALMDSPTVQDTIRPPLPQVQLNPPRFGYRSRELGIDDIVDINEIYDTPVSNTFGGGISGGVQGTTRNSMGTGSW